MIYETHRSGDRFLLSHVAQMKKRNQIEASSQLHTRACTSSTTPTNYFQRVVIAGVVVNTYNWTE